MRKMFVLPVACLALVALAGCGTKAKNETAEASDTVTADANASMVEAASDTEAAADRAFGSGEAMIDNGTAAVGKAGQAAKNLGNEIEE